jgi:hypothetical protein
MEKSSFIHTQKSLSVPRRLQEGVDVWTVASNGKKIEPATLTLGHDKFTIYITVKRQKASLFLRRITTDPSTHPNSYGSNIIGGKDRDKRVIDIGAIDRIQRGQTSISARGSRRQSDTLIVVGKGPGKQPQDKVTPDKCFSIIFRGERQLDLMAQDSMDRDEILDRLDHIIWTYQEAKRKVGNDVLLLRYVWLDADKVRLISEEDGLPWSTTNGRSPALLMLKRIRPGR